MALDAQALGQNIDLMAALVGTDEQIVPHLADLLYRHIFMLRVGDPDHIRMDIFQHFSAAFAAKAGSFPLLAEESGSQ